MTPARSPRIAIQLSLNLKCKPCAYVHPYTPKLRFLSPSFPSFRVLLCCPHLESSSPLSVCPPPPSHPLLSMDSTPYPSPRLPWEVIERVIDHSHCRPKTLLSFVLTCRQLRPRARLAIFSRIRLESRDHVLAFVDFLHKNPHMMPFVHSIVVWPAYFEPDLLRDLPNLSEIWFSPKFHPTVFDMQVLDEQDSGSDPGYYARVYPRNRFPDLHPHTYSCFKRFGTHVRTLHLSDLEFDNLDSFARVILAFPNITHLICNEVDVVEKAPSNGEPLNIQDTIKRWWSQGIKLSTLTVSPPL